MNNHWFNSWWARGSFTLALVVLMLVWVGPASIWDTIKTSQLELLLLSLIFTPLVIGIKTLRWFLLARTQSPIVFQEALHSYLAGLTLAVLTPLAAGEAGRGLFIKTEDTIELTAKVILDKLIDLSAVGMFAGLGLILTKEHTAQTIGALLSLGIIIVWGAVMFLSSKLKEPTATMDNSWLARLQIPVLANSLTNTPFRQLGLNMMLALIGLVFFYSQAFVLLLAFWSEASWVVIPYFPIITLSTILPIAIGGVGIREWTAVLLLKQFGIPESVAFNTFFVHFVVVQLLPALAGAVVISSFRRENE